MTEDFHYTICRVARAYEQADGQDKRKVERSGWRKLARVEMESCVRVTLLATCLLLRSSSVNRMLGWRTTSSGDSLDG